MPTDDEPFLQSGGFIPDELRKSSQDTAEEPEQQSKPIFSEEYRKRIERENDDLTVLWYLYNHPENRFRNISNAVRYVTGVSQEEKPPGGHRDKIGKSLEELSKIHIVRSVNVSVDKRGIETRDYWLTRFGNTMMRRCINDNITNWNDFYEKYSSDLEKDRSENELEIWKPETIQLMRQQNQPLQFNSLQYEIEKMDKEIQRLRDELVKRGVKPSIDVKQLLAEANRFHEKMQYEKVVEIMDLILSEYPNYATALANKGSALHSLGKYFEANLLFDKAIDLDPKSSFALSCKGATFLGKDSKMAAEFFERALRQDDNDLGALNGMGMALSNLKRFDLSVKYFEKALKINKNDSNTWEMLGLSLFLINEDMKALTAFEQALLIDPGNFNALYAKACVLAENDREREALEIFDRMLSIDPNNEVILSPKALALAAMGKVNDAIEIFDKFLEKNPDNIDILTAKGTVLVNSEQYSKAKETLLHLLNLNPNHATALANLGLIMAYEGKPKDGLSLIDKALETYPYNATARYNKDEILKKFGK